LKGGLQNTNETILKLIGLTSRPTLPCFKKIKTHPPHEKKLNFYCLPANGTFGFAHPQANHPSAKPKEPFFPTH
jgi:hypothetical protein